MSVHQQTPPQRSKLLFPRELERLLPSEHRTTVRAAQKIDFIACRALELSTECDALVGMYDVEDGFYWDVVGMAQRLSDTALTFVGRWADTATAEAENFAALDDVEDGPRWTEPTITADERVELVNLSALLAAHPLYWEHDETDDPLLFVFDVNGTEWLTDRQWALPRRLVRGQYPPDEMTPANGVSEASAKTVRDLVERLGSVLLGEPSARFDPALAGPLTEAGLTARPVLGISDDQEAHVLVDAHGRNVGWVMPMRSGAKRTVSIPVPAEVAELQGRIASAGLVRVSESWQLAAALAKSDY